MFLAGNLHEFNRCFIDFNELLIKESSTVISDNEMMYRGTVNIAPTSVYYPCIGDLAEHLFPEALFACTARETSAFSTRMPRNLARQKEWT